MFKLVCFALLLAGICGCAASLPPDTSHCNGCVAFRVLDADLKPTRELIGPDRIAFCGDPISWDEVTVLEVQQIEPLKETVDKKLGAAAEFVDRWFWVALEPNYIKKARHTIASRGCNLLILGDAGVYWYGAGRTDAVSASRDYRMIRWGKY